MTPSPTGPADLSLAVVVRVTEDDCEVVADGRLLVVGYALPFPRPRSERVAPGHLVAVASAPDGATVIVWRWYDAVVVGSADGQVRLWEPAHGEVLARPRRPQAQPALGSRAYASAGLPGAEWWVAGRAGPRAEDADVELDEVRAFLTDVGMWDRLT